MNTRLKPKQKDKIQIQAEQQEEYKLEFVKRIIPKENHTLYEINVETNSITEAKFNLNQDYRLNWNWKKGDRIASKKSLIVNEGCVYVSALNKSNALKQYKKEKDGGKQFFSEIIKF